jgi:outer membrane lipoprotein-sorting protein
MNILFKGILPFFFLMASLVAPMAALADWQGNLTVTSAGKEGGTGKIFAKGGKLRFEMESQGRKMAVLVDTKSRQAHMLMPEQKLAMEVPDSMATQKMVACSTEDVDGCFKKKGYKEVGKETVDGHPCVILEGTETNGGKKVVQKVWRPKDMKEVFMLKSLSKLDDGKEVQTTVSDVKLSKVDDSLFKVPADYKKMKMPMMPPAGASH